MALLHEFNLEPLIALPAARQLTRVSASSDQLTTAARLLYAHGLDDQAFDLVKAVLGQNPEHCAALLLSAQMCPDIVERKRILTQVLILEPTSMEAFENLVMLRTAADEIQGSNS